MNDVALTGNAAYFTDTNRPDLYKIPINVDGSLGPGVTLPLSGPAAAVNFFGGVQDMAATPDGSTLIVDYTNLGELFTIDPATGASKLIHVDGLEAPFLDGVFLAGRNLWVVENFVDKVVRVTLSPDLRAARSRPRSAARCSTCRPGLCSSATGWRWSTPASIRACHHRSRQDHRRVRPSTSSWYAPARTRPPRGVRPHC